MQRNEQALKSLESIDADLHAAKRDGLLPPIAGGLEAMSVTIWHVQKSHEHARKAGRNDRLKRLQLELYERAK